MIKKNKNYIFPEKNNMIVSFKGKYDMYKNGEKGRKIFEIIDYGEYNIKYPNDTLCLFDRDIEELIEIKE